MTWIKPSPGFQSKNRPHNGHIWVYRSTYVQSTWHPFITFVLKAFLVFLTQFRNLLWVKNVKSEYFRGCNHLINQMSKLNKINIFSIIYKMCVSMPFPWSVDIHPYDILLCMHTKVCVSKVPEHPVHPVCCQDPGEISLSSDEPLRCNTFIQTQILILPSLSLDNCIYFTSTDQKYTCKATQIYLILCEASSGSFSQRVSAHDCCSNQHAYFWKKTPPRIFQNLSWVSLFFIFDLKNVNISHDIFDIL